MRRILAAVTALHLLCVPALAVENFGDGAQFDGHMTSANAVGNPPPVVTNGTLRSGSTDLAGQLTTTATSAVAVAFGKAFVSTPTCVVVDATTGTGNLLASGPSTTGFTLGTTGGTDKVSWVCVGQQGN